MLRLSGKLWTAITVVAVVAMVSQVAVAQNEGGRRGRGGRGGAGGPGGVSMLRLLTVDKVQDALKLTEDQESKIKTINDDMRKEMREEFQSGGGRDREKMRKLMDSTEEKVNGVLDAGQQKRLMGIYIQVAGASAVMNPAVAKELNITDEQKTKIHDMMAEMRPGRGQAKAKIVRPSGNGVRKWIRT